MTVLEWVLTLVLFSTYLVCVVTVCALTFRKGHIVLGIIGIFFPILWLIGAVLPAKEGSPHAVQEAMQRQHRAEQIAP
jgi:hypothetical protein